MIRKGLNNKLNQTKCSAEQQNIECQSVSVQSDLYLVLDINYQNVNLHNDDTTVEHLDNVDKDIPYIFSALPLRAF